MLHIIDNDKEFLIELGKFVSEASLKAIADHGYFSIAFSGGSAATKICAAFQNEKYVKETDFSKWKMFLSDERYVDLDHPDSNFKAINDGLIAKQEGVQMENVFTLQKTGSLDTDAAEYETKMRSVFKNVEFPKLDLIVLGMGPDGHICSLFPNHALLREENKWIGHLEDSPKPPSQRITFTMKVVNNASNVIFIATGKSKADNIKRAVEGQPGADIPASLVKPLNGSLHWFMDNAAASKLSNRE